MTDQKLKNKLWSALGLSMRAGKCVAGEEQVITAVRSKKASLVMIAVDASKRTTKTIEDKCNFYRVPFLQVGSREELGHSIGKDERVVIAITDHGIAHMIRKHAENLSEVKDIE